MAQVLVLGIEEIERKLSVDLGPAMRGATKAIAAEIQGKIAPYPRSTSANSPAGPGSRWYERGYGPRWMRKDGGVGGRKTSETLGRRWGITSHRTSATLSNKASYAVYVHGAEKQARFHSRRGWKTDKWAIKQVWQDGTVEKIIDWAIQRAMRGR